MRSPGSFATSYPRAPMRIRRLGFVPPRTTRRLAYAPIETSLGRLLVGFRGEMVLRSSLTDSPARFASELGEQFGLPPEARDALPAALQAGVRAATDGELCTLDFDLSTLTPFQQQVLRATLSIPYGHTWTYGELAERVGAPHAARAVGTALSKNPVPFLIPCHRVVRSGGDVGQYGMGGVPTKKRLLRREGSLDRSGRLVG